MVFFISTVGKRGAHNVTASAPKTRLPGAPSIFSLLPFSALTSRFTLSHVMPVGERREGERQWRKKRPTTEKLLIGRFAFLPSVCLLPKNERARWKLAAMFKNLSSSFYWVRSACSKFCLLPTLLLSTLLYFQQWELRKVFKEVIKFCTGWNDRNFTKPLLLAKIS